ncbi:type II secretion system major pseudopilin GspG [Fulvimonas sp. R45]|jgi:general secretion pathway protein G|uniref:type II secretion system major pseudopilin GspG n=1 Tax=Fulvimonas sp. R45 TaxID=3045937 RepID=UPI00265ED5ED|nr:type II secretion system major pseudopilin GspG [Fulvimonas sp. R45]MDO1528944.1 type II secretion system major pseudopilin GspG [Fulvimonas sp. R45]
MMLNKRREQEAESGEGAGSHRRGRSPFPASRSPRAHRARGFTLLEMLAVIVLIGIIGTIVVRQVGHSVDKGKYGAGKAQLTTLGQDIDSYALDNGAPPRQLADLLTKPASAPNWQGPYAKASQLKDPWGHDFGYQYPGEHGNYDLIFYGRDGKAGGDGYDKDVGNWQ